MRRASTIALLLVSALLAGCGGGDGGGRPDITVSAATSLRTAVRAYGGEFAPARVHVTFGGSDEMAARIRAGERPDVLAAANATLPNALFAEGLVEKPVAFARDRLVIAVPAEGARVETLHDLSRTGIRLAIGAPSAPAGSHTRAVLAALPATQRNEILANVRAQAPGAGGVTGGVAAGAADAGFAYASDVQGSGGRLRAIALPDRLQPEVRYEAAVVRGTKHAGPARAFVAGLRAGAGRRELDRAGFLSP